MIEAAETRITGNWVVDDGRVCSDEAEKRIHELIATHLLYLAVDQSGWQKLYQDPIDERYWELTFPQGELQGGGPAELRCIDKKDALKKYSLISNL
jgi:hypothetical protein